MLGVRSTLIAVFAFVVLANGVFGQSAPPPIEESPLVQGAGTWYISSLSGDAFNALSGFTWEFSDEAEPRLLLNMSFNPLADGEDTKYIRVYPTLSYEGVAYDRGDCVSATSDEFDSCDHPNYYARFKNANYAMHSGPSGCSAVFEMPVIPTGSYADGMTVNITIHVYKAVGWVNSNVVLKHHVNGAAGGQLTLGAEAAFAPWPPVVVEDPAGGGPCPGGGGSEMTAIYDNPDVGTLWVCHSDAFTGFQGSVDLQDEGLGAITVTDFEFAVTPKNYPQVGLVSNWRSADMSIPFGVVEVDVGGAFLDWLEWGDTVTTADVIKTDAVMNFNKTQTENVEVGYFEMSKATGFGQYSEGFIIHWQGAGDNPDDGGGEGGGGGTGGGGSGGGGEGEGEGEGGGGSGGGEDPVDGCDCECGVPDCICEHLTAIEAATEHIANEMDNLYEYNYFEQLPLLQSMAISLGTVDGTLTSIDSTATGIEENTGSTASNTGELVTQTDEVEGYLEDIVELLEGEESTRPESPADIKDFNDEKSLSGIYASRQPFNDTMTFHLPGGTTQTLTLDITGESLQGGPLQPHLTLMTEKRGYIRTLFTFMFGMTLSFIAWRSIW